MSEMENLFSDSIEYNADDLEMFEKKEVLWRESSHSMAFIHIQCLESNLHRALFMEQTLSDCVFFVDFFLVIFRITSYSAISKEMTFKNIILLEIILILWSTCIFYSWLERQQIVVQTPTYLMLLCRRHHYSQNVKLFGKTLFT